MGKIVLTGASGFIGSNFISFLKKTGENILQNLVIVASNPVENFITINRYKNMKEQFSEILSGEEIETVYHLGAFTPKDSSQANMIAECNENINFTFNLLNSLPVTPQKFIFASTLDIYNFSTLVSEHTIPQPQTLYGFSKLYCEKMLEQWSAEKKCLLQIARIGHVYGAGEQQYKKLIPQAIKTCLDNKTPEVFTSGNEKRSFIHVEDVCRLLWAAGQLPVYDGPINLVSSQSLSVSEIVKIIISLTNPGLQMVVRNQYKGTSTVFDNSKMKLMLGTEQILFTEGLQEEIEYFKKLKNAE